MCIPYLLSPRHKNDNPLLDNKLGWHEVKIPKDNRPSIFIFNAVGQTP